MTSQWPKTLSRGGLVAGVTLIGIAAVSTLYLILSTTGLLDEALLAGIVGIGVLSAVTGAAVYGYGQLDDE